MKNKSFKVIFMLVTASTILSCKNDKSTSEQPAAKPVEDNSFSITMNLTVPKDDNFQIYYNEDGSDVYAADKYVDVAVKGNTNPQDVTFKLPEDAFPTSLRFDLGSNKEQGKVKINDFKMKYYDKKFEAKDTLFIYYFGNNQQIDYDRKNATATPKVIKNETYDPIFTGTELLKTEIKKLVK